MASVLVIVESPTKAKTIGKFLNRKRRTKYYVEASKGHVRDLPKSRMGVDIENSFTPQYITIRGKGEVVKELRKLANKCDSVILATDPDREGEAISWHLAKALKLDMSQPLRVVFHEITQSAINKAFCNPRPINHDLVDAQQARRVLDRVVGYQLSPLLWRKVRKGLSAGRVQSVAVKLVVDRERERDAFVPEEYWTLEAYLKTKAKDTLTAKFYGTEADGRIKLISENQVKAVESDIKGKDFLVKDIVKKERKKHPAAPFTTSTLQQEAARKLGFAAKKTMRIAQQLYEGVSLGRRGSTGLITYMRTDSVELSEQARAEAKDFILKNYGQEYYLGHRYKSKNRVQGAHEAIRPTSIERTPESVKEYLDKNQHKLYGLIWKRAVASQMSQAVMDHTRVDIQVGKYLFRATGNTVKFPGFMTLYTEGQDEADREQEGILPEVSTGENLRLLKIVPNQHFTEPPPRYTEAALVKTLEEKGIGRPSTYAPTIDTISKRGYVAKEKRRFKPTDLAFVVTDLLEEYFGDIINVEFTSQLEDRLDNVEDGEVNWVHVVDDFYKTFAKDLEVADKNIEKVELVDEVTEEICEKCGRNMVIKHGRFGKFMACPGFPECRNTKPLIKEIGVKCPICGGDVIEKRSKKGRIFYGCKQYPDCDFVSWDKPTNKKCPVCGSYLVEKHSKKTGTYYVCSKKDCNHKEAGEKTQ